MAKPFSWSWSKLKNYRSCPKRHYHVDIAKEFKDEAGENLLWGNRVHDAMAARITKGTPLPQGMQSYEDWPRQIELLHKAKGDTVLAENKLAMTRDFTATGFFADDVWFRAVVDVLIMPSPIYVVSYDWKTGAVKPDMEQLGLSSQVIFAHYPEVQAVGSRYVWLGTDSHTTVIHRRDSMVPLWNGLWPEIKEMEEAHRTLTYPPRPSGLCRKYCPVTSCPHHGRGSFD